MRRWVRAVLWFSILALLMSSGMLLYLKRPVTAVTVDDALARFRQSQPTADSLAAEATGDAVAPATTAVAAGGQAGPAEERAVGEPEPAVPGKDAAARSQAREGVYLYATEGYESTDALGGSRHDYPAETTTAVRNLPCGSVQRWQPLSERWDETEVCRESAGFAMRRLSIYHEFFQRGVQDDFRCGADAIVLPYAPESGRSWRYQCKAPENTIDIVASVVGIEKLDVGGRSYDAVHVHLDGKMSGANDGTQSMDRWMDPSTGLAYRITVKLDARVASPFGQVGYEERYDIKLKSTTPRT